MNGQPPKVPALSKMGQRYFDMLWPYMIDQAHVDGCIKDIKSMNAAELARATSASKERDGD